MAVREGLELAAKMFQPQLPHVEGITEEEIKRLKVICSNAPKVVNRTVQFDSRGSGTVIFVSTRKN
jgi:hypothetical protein